MNLHGIVSGYLSAVNPPITVTIQPSTGYATNADGSRVPTYGASQSVQAQRQALQYTDIVQMDGLNIQGTRCKLYLNGNWNGLVRADQKGGDLITLPDGSIWLVAVIAENWSEQDGWTCVLCTLQDNS